MGFVLHFSPHGSKRVSIFYTPINMMISAKDNAKSLKILKKAPRTRFYNRSCPKSYLNFPMD